MSLGKVLIQENNLKSANFDFGHDAPTTLEFGVIQPVHLKQVNAGTKSRLASSSTTYFAPLTVPTHGKIFLHEYTQFVSFSSLFKQFPYFLAQLPRLNSASSTHSTPEIPLQMPKIDAPMLMWHLSRHGNSAYYLRSRGSNGEVETANPWYLWTAETSDDVVFQSWRVQNTLIFKIRELPRVMSVNDPKYFKPNTYDFSWYNELDGPQHRTLLKLTKTGSRLLSAFLACGMKPCMDYEVTYDVAPLFALYKAYYDIMEAPISQYNNFENTSLARLLKFYDVNGLNVTYSTNMENSALNTRLHELWTEFIDDLCEMYYTSNMNYLSAHMPEDFAENNPLLRTDVMDIVNHAGQSGLTQSFDGSQGGTLNPTSKLYHNSGSSVTLFNQLSDEWCKMAYYQINKRSQLGYALKKELKMRGYKDWCYDNDSAYINHSRTLVPITQLQNQSDTLTSNGGDVVGQRVGNAQVSSKTFSSTHYANESGFVIHLVTIVPEIRVCNGASEDSLTTEISEWYSPLTDGFGYSATPRIATGIFDHCEVIDNELYHKTFGISPRHFGKKIAHNLKLGGFALRSQQNTYAPYYLDMPLDEHYYATQLVGDVQPNGNFVDTMSKANTALPEIPNAGKAWRQFAKYNIFNKYNRIFDYRGRDMYDFYTPIYPEDNIICLLEIKHSATAKMLPTSKSWDTIECEDEHANTFSHEK